MIMVEVMFYIGVDNLYQLQKFFILGFDVGFWRVQEENNEEKFI